MASSLTAERAALSVYSVSDLSEAELKEVTARPRVDFASILNTVGILSCPPAKSHLFCRDLRV